jgi:oxygen-dependent protoporphyrinogen oxidase
MIGKLNPNDKRVTIVGAGISGLLIGYALKRKGYQVTIHEKTNRCGGLIETKHTPYGIVETAAHSILVNQSVKSLLDELGVEVIGVNPDSKARYIYRKGKMRRMPLTILEIIKTLIRFFSKPKLTKSLSELTLAEWGNAYLGNAATEYLLAPFTTGVFACHPKELNTKLSFPKLLPSSPQVSLFQHLRSLKKTSKSDRGQMMVFKSGTEELIQKLEAKLKDNIIFNSSIHDLNKIEGNLILSVPAVDIQYSPLITATVFMPLSAFAKKAPKGVGVLIPRGEGLRILGVLFNSSAFDGRTALANHASLTVMIGGTSDPDAIHLSESEIIQIIESDLSTLFNTIQPPAQITITKWPKAIPVYSSHLSDYITHLDKEFCKPPGKLIFTNFSGQVSIRGMIETIQKI